MDLYDVLFAQKYGYCHDAYMTLFARAMGGGKAATISGTPPLILTDAYAKLISSMVQYGAVKQDGTPTPSATKDIVCNNGALRYGLLGINLFDKDSEQKGNYYVNSSGNIATANSNACIYFRCQPNTTYYFKHTSVVGGCRAFTVSVEDWTTGTPANEMIGSVTAEPNEVQSITTEADAKWIFFLYGRSTGTTATFEEQAADFMVSTEPMDANTPYEPYKGIGIYTEGEPEVLRVNSLNLFDASKVIDENKYVSSNTGKTSTPGSGVFRASGFIPVTVGETYFFGVTPYTAVTAGMAWYSSPSEDDYLSGRSGNWLGSNGWKDTAPSSAKYVRFSIRIDEGYDTNWQNTVYCCKDGDLNAYVPFFESKATPIENLLAVGNVKDTQEIISGTVTRRIGIYVFDGTETWINGNYGYITEVVNDQSGESYSALCTHYKGTTGTPSGDSNTFRMYRTSGDVGRIYIAPNRTTYPTKEDFADYIKAQYVQGTPVIVIYPLATPVTEQVTPQPLSTTKGTNIVSVEAEVVGDIEVTYTSST